MKVTNKKSTEAEKIGFLPEKISETGFLPEKILKYKKLYLIILFTILLFLPILLP